MEKPLAILLIFLGFGFLLSCGSTEPPVPSSSHRERPPSPSKYYTTAYPQVDMGDQFKDIRRSILRIVSTGYYNTYLFEDSLITQADLMANKPEDISSQRFSTEESTAGTAIILQKGWNNMLLITCDHIVSFPDTVINYYKAKTIPDNTYIRSISIKQKQSNLIFAPRGLHKFEIISSDPRTDLALIISNVDSPSMRTLDIGVGDSKRLQYGSFLYVMGFPKGYSVITPGITADLGNSGDRFFILDALFNPGISGGIVIASRDQFRSFEWVGMARSATVSKEDLLVPQPGSDQLSRTVSPYRDSVYAQQKSRIAYGISLAISIDRIKDFIADNRKAILRSGFSYSAK